MFKSRKILRGALATVVSVCILSIAAFAYTGTGKVNVSTYLNVRQSYSTSSPIIGKLYKGNQIAIIGIDNGWYEINYNGKDGWVSSSYVLNENTPAQIAVDTAESELGVKYVFDEASPTSGFDCSGLTMYAYSKAGITLPHSSAAQAAMGTYVPKADLQPGDIVFFDTDGSPGQVTHCGIYIGNGNFIDAESGVVQKVITASLSNTYWSSVYITARRYAQ